MLRRSSNHNFIEFVAANSNQLLKLLLLPPISNTTRATISEPQPPKERSNSVDQHNSLGRWANNVFVFALAKTVVMA